jgi:hypothetical protein
MVGKADARGLSAARGKRRRRAPTPCAQCRREVSPQAFLNRAEIMTGPEIRRQLV